MSSKENEENIITLLGIRNKRATTTGIAVDEKTPETAWEIYNTRATVYDKELIKDWNDSLNTLLIFAALYSAVLTAFIVESMKLLREDTSETTRDILLVITKQLANASTPAFEPNPFIVQAYAIRVNAYFFISISSNLIAALGSVLALQWVGSYDFGLNSSSPKDRALQRHFRYMGINEWRMAEIIAVLPILLFVALFLFLIGLADWLFNVHGGLSSIMMLGVAIAAIFYATTTILSIRHADAPFQTPVSKSLPIIFNIFSTSVKNLLSFLPGRNTGKQSTTRSEHYFEKREENAIKHRPLFDVDCLLWAVNSIGVLPHAREAFRILMEEFVELPTQQLLDPKINRAPWLSIFTMFCRPYSNKEKYEDYNEELKSGDVRLLAQGIAMVGFATFDKDTSTMLEKFLNSLVNPNSVHFDAVMTFAWHALCRHTRNAPKLYFHKSLDSTIQNLLTTPTKFSQLSLMVLQERQTQQPKLFSGDIFNGLQDHIGRYCDIDMEEVMESPLIPPQLLDILLQMAATDIAGHAITSLHPLSAYLTAYQDAYREGEIEDRHRNALRAIRRQYIARLMQMPKDAGVSTGMDAILDFLYDIVLLTSEDTSSGTKQDLFSIFSNVNFKEKVWKLPRSTIAKLFSLAYGVPATFDSNNWPEWVVQITINFDRRINEGYYGKENSLLFMGLFCETLNVFSHHITYNDTLTSIQNPCVLLIVSTFLGFPDILFSLFSFSPSLWEDPLWQATAEWSCGYVQFHWLWQAFNSTYIRFARSVLAHGSQVARENCVAMLAAIAALNSTSLPDISLELFREPTLHDLITLPGYNMRQDRLRVLYKISDCAWFSQEFIRINGIPWLEQEIETVQEYDLCIKLIGNIVKAIVSHSQLIQLTKLTRECLIGTSEVEGARYIHQARQYDTLLRAQAEKKLYISSESSNQWSPEEWEEWYLLASEVVEGLKRGYIISYWPRFLVDADGICGVVQRSDVSEEDQRYSLQAAAN